MVQVKPNNEGSIVTAYENNPEFGYVILKSEETVFDNGWMDTKERTTLMRGKTDMLSKHFTAGKVLQGRISVVECTENNIPAKQAMQLDAKLPFEEQIEPFLKRAGSNDAPVLMAGEERILRFTEYDASGTTTDIRVAHTNSDAIKAFNATVSDSAQLPS